MNQTNPTPEQVQAYISTKLHCARIEVDGDGRHFHALIVSPEFESLSMVARHQRVYAALGDKMKEEIHALSMKTYTPSEYENIKK